MSTPRNPDHPAAYLSPSCVDKHEYMDPGYWNSLSVIRSSPQLRRLLGLHRHGPVTRRKKETIPPEKQDAAYMSKRLKNNEAAKRSRERRRMKDLLLGDQLLALRDENAQLRDQILRLQYTNMCAEKVKGAPGRVLCPAYSPSVSVKSPSWGENLGNLHESIHSCSWIRGFDSLSQSSGLLPHYGPRVPPAVAGMERMEAGGFSPHIIADASSVRAFPPALDAIHPAPMLPNHLPTGLVPGPAVGSHFRLPWWSPYLASMPPYPTQPL